MTEQEKVFDILNKFEFFQGQRAGRELWNDKPKEVQDKDIADFIKDINYIRSYLQNSVVLSREEHEILVKTAQGKIGNMKATDFIRACISSGVMVEAVSTKEQVRQAVKEFADKLKIKLFEFFKDNEELDGKISVGPLYVDVIGVEAKDGTIISLGLIDELLKECLND